MPIRICSFTLITLLLSFFNSVTAQSIHRIACQGKLATLDSLLTNTSIDVKDDWGQSLMHWAVGCDQKEVFDYLVRNGVDIKATDNEGRTAMHIAIKYNREPYLKVLIELQADNLWRQQHGGSLMELAVLKESRSITEILLAAGVDINIKNDRGSTALEISKRLGAKDLSQWLINLGADQGLVRHFELKGDYMGQEPPGSTPKLFAPNFISTEEQEFGSVFNAEGTEFYFSVDDNGKNEIRYSILEDNTWTQPEVLLTHERYSYNDPFLSPDEQRLYFISNRALDGTNGAKDIDIWYVERDGSSWSQPINAGPSINTDGDEYYISFTDEGTMYFASNGRPTEDSSRTDHDIFYSKRIDGTFREAVLLGDEINTQDYEADVFVSPDESYLIFCSVRDRGFGGGDLYISFKTDDNNWTKAINMGPKINSFHYEYCPYVSTDGKYLFYTSQQDIYWVSTSIIEELKEKSK